MLISEIFYSVQGEGELTGVPTVFVRTSGCNLRCAWCDTKYASWTPEGEQMSVDAIAAEVARHPAGHVVLTGGEPMIAKGIRELAERLKAMGRHITIETAGTIAPDGIPCDLASLSPKLSHSTPRAGEIPEEWIARHEAARFQPAVIRQWLENYPYQLKWVVSSASDLAEIDAAVAAIGLPIPPHKLLLMPEGTDAAALASRAQWLVEICKSRGNRYCDRLHVQFWGHKRGT